MRAFDGVWALEQVEADGAQGPESAVYTLLEDGEDLVAHLRWCPADDPVQQTGFRVTLDGKRHALPGVEGVELSGELTDNVLSTSVWANGSCASRSEHRLLEDGRMSVDQRHFGPDDDVSFSRQVYRRSDVKQVLVYRRDLKMRKGKIAAQCAHGSMAVFFRRQRKERPVNQLEVPLDGPMAAWVRRSFAKIVLSVESEQDLLTIHQAAQAAGLPCSLITDAGRTEFKGVPTRTVVAIGPAEVSEIDRITGREGLVATKLA